MSRVHRRKAYKSRRERTKRDWRIIRLVLLFAVIAIGFLVMKNWRELSRWIGTYFY